jgi:hypothetical protein
MFLEMVKMGLTLSRFQMINANKKRPPPVQNKRKIVDFVSGGTRCEYFGDQRIRYVVRRPLPIKKVANTIW